MGLNEKAQEEVDQRLALLWWCYTSGAMATSGESASRIDFGHWLEKYEPDLRLYYSPEIFTLADRAYYVEEV